MSAAVGGQSVLWVQALLQMPDVHLWPAAQTWKQAPQLFGSLVRSAQALPQNG